MLALDPVDHSTPRPNLNRRAKHMANLIDRETAEREFDRMCDKMDVDTDLSDLNEEDVESFNSQKLKVVKAIEAGSVTVNDDGLPTYTTKAGKELAVREITGTVLVSLDHIKKSDEIRRLFKMIQEITASNIKPAELGRRDISVLGAMVGLFLAV